jgi:hypothetical protein
MQRDVRGVGHDAVEAEQIFSPEGRALPHAMPTKTAVPREKRE